MTGIESGLAATGAAAISEAVRLSLKELHNFISNKSKHLVEKWRAERGFEDLYQHVNSIRLVKTIWQIDKSVNLKEFYVPPHIKIEGSKREKINSIDDILSENSILLEGIAGQGKSTFLRYLCSNEMIEGSRIPIFIELRRIKKGETIFDHISRNLEILGIILNKELILDFMKTGRFSIYLDGFDEVENTIRSEVINDIELICLTQGNGRIIVTSRPGQTVRAMACLKIIKLDNLIKDEYKEVIFKISENREYAESLIRVIEGHKRDIKGMLCTPLFVTLLVISYKSYQQIPEKLSDFYDSLFRVLLQRHDGTKPAYSRPRATGLNDIKFRETFELFCFLTKKHKNNILSYNDIIEVATNTIKKLTHEIDPTDLIKDISEVTCLIVNDGDEWRFIHKSIQEYFSASHIKSNPDIKAQKIYTELTKHYRPEWEEEIRFLAEIDEYRYAKYFFIPCIKKLIGNSSNLENTKPIVTPQIVKNVLGCYTASFKIEKDNPFNLSIEIKGDIASPLHELIIDCTDFFINQIADQIRNVPKKIQKRLNIEIETSLNSILAASDGKKMAHDFVEKTINKLHLRGVNYEQMIKKIESENVDAELFS